MREEISGTSWNHYNPVRVARTSLDNLAHFVSANAHVLLVTSKGFSKRGVVDYIKSRLQPNLLTVWDDVNPNPGLQELDCATMEFRKKGIDAVIGLGGGSALDSAKVLALTLTTAIPRPLKAIFREKVDVTWHRRLPLLVVPTTAGTGAEVTPFATVWDHEKHRKHSLGHPLMFPDTALLDARLTLTLPQKQTLYPALDTVSHALESLWNQNATPVSRTLAKEALSLAVEALPGVLEQPNQLAHREDMQLSSMLAGMAISQTRTAVAHAISYPITMRFGVPHGLACSFTLPTLLKINLEHLSTNQSEKQLFANVLEMLTSLDLPSCMQEYVNLEQLLLLQNEMVTPERSSNYTGPEKINLTDLIQSALVKT